MTTIQMWGTGDRNHVPPSDNEVSLEVGAGDLRHRQARAGCLFASTRTARLYSSPAILAAGAAPVFSDRLPRTGRTGQRVFRTAPRARTRVRASFHNAPKSRKEIAKKGAIDRFLDVVFELANERGLLPTRPAGSVDSTGFESHYVSRHFLKRSGRVKRYRRWIKLTMVCEHLTHLIASAIVNVV